MKLRSAMSPTFFTSWITGSRQFTIGGCCYCLAVAPDLLGELRALVGPDLDPLAVAVPRPHADLELLLVDEEFRPSNTSRFFGGGISSVGERTSRWLGLIAISKYCRRSALGRDSAALNTATSPYFISGAARRRQTARCRPSPGSPGPRTGRHRGGARRRVRSARTESFSSATDQRPAWPPGTAATSAAPSSARKILIIGVPPLVFCRLRPRIYRLRGGAARPWRWANPVQKAASRLWTASSASAGKRRDKLVDKFVDKHRIRC